METEINQSTDAVIELSKLERELNSTELDERNIWQKGAYWYFKPRSFERKGTIYELLGVKKFKKAYVDFINKRFNMRILSGRNEKSLRDCIGSTKRYEGIHVIGNAVMTPMIIAPLLSGDYKFVAVAGAINTLVNIYPIMLQRYNRSRLYNTLEKVEGKKTPAH